MGQLGRNRKPGKRTPSGQLSREGRAAAEALSPAMLGLLKQEVIRSLQNPLWGTQLGIMNLGGELTTPEHEAGRRWTNLAVSYQRALGAKGIRPVSFERVGASCDYDPDSDEGREIAEMEKRICEDFEEALRALYDAGRAAAYAVRLLCEENQVLSWQQKRDAKCGLLALVEHWELTKPVAGRMK